MSWCNSCSSMNHTYLIAIIFTIPKEVYVESPGKKNTCRRLNFAFPRLWLHPTLKMQAPHMARETTHKRQITNCLNALLFHLAQVGSREILRLQLFSCNPDTPLLSSCLSSTISPSLTHYTGCIGISIYPARCIQHTTAATAVVPRSTDDGACCTAFH